MFTFELKKEKTNKNFRKRVSRLENVQQKIVKYRKHEVHSSNHLKINMYLLLFPVLDSKLDK